MCWVKKTGRIRRINQVAFEATSVGEPNLPFAFCGLSGDTKWVRRLRLYDLAAKATWAPFDVLAICIHATPRPAR